MQRMSAPPRTPETPAQAIRRWGVAGWLICGVDDRDEARALCVFATHLARRLGLRPMVVHVTQVAPTFPYGNHEIIERQRRAALERGRQALSRALAGCALPEDAVADRVEIGETAARLVELAEEQEAALIVVGSRGR